MKGPNGQLPRLRPDLRLYFFHGSDEGAAAELAKHLAAALPEAERVDLDGPTLRKEPGRLADEAASSSLFGTARLIRAQPIGEESMEALTLLLDAPHADAPVIAVAPTVRSTAKIVALANGHPRALAIACYPLSDDQQERLVAAMLAEQGIRAAPRVAARLAEASGGDRAIVAREVEKLALYLDAAPERPRDAGTADLDAIGADLGEAAQDEAVEALLAGEPGALGQALLRLDEGGASAIPWLRAAQRRLIALADMRAEVERGQAPAAAMKRARVNFTAEAATARALRRWNPAMLADALARLRRAERAVMATANAGAVIAERETVTLAAAVERRG